MLTSLRMGCHIKQSLGQLSHIGLTSLQRDQSLVSGIADRDNSLSMRWGKSGARSSINHPDGAGTGGH